MLANYIVKTYMLFDFPPSSIMNYEMTVVYLMGILFTNLLKEKKSATFLNIDYAMLQLRMVRINSKNSITKHNKLNRERRYAGKLCDDPWTYHPLANRNNPMQ